MKAILWGLLIVQALAFTVGLALQGEPVIPGTPGGLHAVGTLTDKFLALLGLLATVALCALFASRDRAARLFGLGMGAAALLIGWLLLQARPFGLSVTIAAITLVTFVVLVATLVQDRESYDEAGDEEVEEASEPQTYPQFSIPLEAVTVTNEHPAYKRVSAPLQGYGLSEQPMTQPESAVPSEAASGSSAPHSDTIPPFSVRLNREAGPSEKSAPA